MQEVVVIPRAHDPDDCTQHGRRQRDFGHVTGDSESKGLRLDLFTPVWALDVDDLEIDLQMLDPDER